MTASAFVCVLSVLSVDMRATNPSDKSGKRQ